jgi:hypothetical protein
MITQVHRMKKLHHQKTSKPPDLRLNPKARVNTMRIKAALVLVVPDQERMRQRKTVTHSIQTLRVMLTTKRKRKWIKRGKRCLRSANKKNWRK